MKISILVLIATVAVSVWTFQGTRERYDKLLFQPWRMVREGEYWRFVTSGFIHADWFHLIFNAITFYFFCVPLESMVGAWQWAVIYFGSLLIADLPAYFKHKNNFDFRSLGASGAISGGMFAFILYQPWSKLSLMLLPIPIPAPLFAVLYVAYSYFAGRRGQDIINHEAHLYGALGGAGLAILLNPELPAAFIEYLLN
jgi:membrane associated rhomboid family serine protease